MVVNVVGSTASDIETKRKFAKACGTAVKQA
jgi:hypothetical protein